MTVKEIINTACERKGITLTKLAEMLELNQANVSHALNNNDGMKMKVDTLIKMLDELELQIVIQSCYEDDEEMILDGDGDFY